MPSPFQATRYHSLIVDRKDFPKDLEVTAETGDIIMGLRHKTLPIHGVQFHPESIASETRPQDTREFPQDRGRPPQPAEEGRLRQNHCHPERSEGDLW